jgi:hypothetical protein
VRDYDGKSTGLEEGIEGGSNRVAAGLQYFYQSKNVGQVRSGWPTQYVGNPEGITGIEAGSETNELTDHYTFLFSIESKYIGFGN